MKNRRRPSWSNILAVIVALYIGATCYGCTYVAAPVPAKPHMSCVLLTRQPYSDSLVIGVYDPPCERNADSVFYWQVPLNNSCGLLAWLDANAGAGKVQPICPPPTSGVRLGSSPRG